jgi:formate-dependent nitrite reductase membrane component NrfD
MHLSTTWSIIITAIPALLIVTSGLFKFSGSKQIVETLTKVGVIQYARYLGIAEIVFAILFVIPATNPIGFILLACYFSGALATDLSHGSKIVAPLMILGSLFIAQLLANAEIFF